MYNLLSSIKITWIIGAGVGIICRFYFHFTLVAFSVPPPVETEVWALTLIFVGWGSLLGVMWSSPKRFLTEYSLLMKAFVLNHKLKKEEINKVFPTA